MNLKIKEKLMILAAHVVAILSSLGVVILAGYLVKKDEEKREHWHWD